MRVINRLIILATMLATPALAKPVKPAIFAPKVMVITMFAPEAKPWLEREDLPLKFKITGLHKDFDTVACSKAGLCVMTTGAGFSNAATSTAAIVLSPKFNLKKTYFIIAGIAGVDPADGTLGSAHWARYAVNGMLRHEIDPRQMPKDWTTGYVALGAEKPGGKPDHYGETLVYRLNEDLLQKAFAITRNVELADSDYAVTYRKHHPEAATKPFVSICDTESADLYWHGSLISKQMQDWSALVTDGAANYCTTQMEDNATLTALKRGAEAGRLDFDRIALLRTASNFDSEGFDQTPAESMLARSGGYPLGLENAWRVGTVLAHELMK
jgi:purine nucleoside permease